MTDTPQTYSPRQMLERLVAFDTVSARSNLALIHFVRAYLGEHEIACTLLPNEQGDKASLYARIGPAEGAGIGLSGHSDVVPVAGQTWSSDPFRLSERDGRLYGRGACDMKGFLAVCLALVPEMAAARLATPIDLFISYDEEIGCTGVLDMVNALGKSIPMPRAVIVGEPTLMSVVDAHKSAHEFLTEVTGLEAHSSLIHLGANAVFAAAPILAEIASLRDELIARGDPSGRFTPPYSTVHVGRIEGGTAMNIVPRRCAIHWEMRGLPGVDTRLALRRIDAFATDKVLPGLRAVSADTGVTTHAGVFVPGLAPEPGSPAEHLVKRLARRNVTEAVSYVTEAGHFQGAGVATLICGPGSIEQAHKGDEYIEIAQLDACTAFIRRLIDELSR